MSALHGALGMIRAEQGRHATEVPVSREVDAQAVLGLISRYNPSQYSDRQPEEYARELHEWTIQIAQTNLTRDELCAGVRRHYASALTPWITVGEVLSSAREVRRAMRQGSVVAELLALPAAPPSKGPVRAAYGSAVEVECSSCGAAVGAPCVNSRTGTYRRVPCVSRMVGLGSNGALED